MNHRGQYFTHLCGMMIVLFLASLMQGQVAARLTGKIDENTLVTLKHNVHPLAKVSADQGLVAGDLALRRMVLLLKRSDAQEAALVQLLDEQQTPGSANYHHWLTPEEFGASFGPAEADVAVVTSWLESHGFVIGHVARGGVAIEFSGTASQVNETFRTEMHHYLANGKIHTANASDPKIPSALAPVAGGIVTLHNFGRKHDLHVESSANVKSNLTIQSGGNYYLAVGPGDFATIYDTLPLLSASSPIDGTGSTIAVLGESSIQVSDVTAFRQMFGMPVNNPTIINNGETPVLDVGGEEVESDLDVQWAGATAPGATVKFVTSESTEVAAGIDLSALYAIENNLADIITLSYGACESDLGAAGNSFYKKLWEQAAAQGITVLVSSGDDGSANCDAQGSEDLAIGGLAVSGIASTPYNTAVGGTDFQSGTTGSAYWSTTNAGLYETSALSYIPETTWNQTCAQGYTTSATAAANCASITSGTGLWSGSGGASSQYSKPAWQSGTGVPSDGKRDLPDLALLSSGYYVTCSSDYMGAGCSLSDFLVSGGTSASTPAMAGVLALVRQKEGSRLGNVNNVLYALARTYPAAFHDITTGNISVPCTGGTANCSSTSSATNGVIVDSSGKPAYLTTTGYDMATGLGSIDANVLVSDWSKVTLKASTTTISVPTGTTLTHGANSTVNVTVTPTAATGDVSLIADYGNGTTVSVGKGTLASGGTYTFSSVILPGGSYNLYAHYAGDTVYGTSDSAGVAITVSPETSKTWLNLITFDNTGSAITSTNATSVVYGSYYILRVGVTNSSASAYSTSNTTPCSNTLACPTGTVTIIFDKGKTSEVDLPLTLNSLGSVEYQAISLTAGTHTIEADYAGDKGFNTSSSSESVMVSKVTTALAFSSTLTATTYKAVTLQVTLTTNVPATAPKSGITFTVNGQPFSGTITYKSYAATSTSGASTVATLTAYGLTASGNYAVVANYAGDSNYQSATASSTLVVSDATTNAPDFAMGVGFSGQIPLTQGNVFSGNMIALYTNGFYSNVTLSYSISPTVTNGPIVTWTPLTMIPVSATYSESSALSINTQSNTPAGTYVLTVTSACGALTHTTTINVIVVSPDFSFGLLGPQVVSQGSSVSKMFYVLPDNGFTGNVVLTAAVSPVVTNGPTVSVPSPVALNGTTTSMPSYSLVTTSSTPLQAYTVTITGTSGSLTHSASFPLTVAKGDYSVAFTSITGSVEQGGTVYPWLQMTEINNFPDTLAFSYSVSPALTVGPTLTGLPSVPVVADNGFMTTINVPAATPVGTYVFTIAAVSSGATATAITHTMTYTLTVTAAPDFSLAASPSTLSVVQGNLGSSTVTMTPINSFTGNATLTAAISPTTNAPTLTLGSSTLTASANTSTVNVATTSSTAIGTYTVTVTGSGTNNVGALTHAATFTIVVTPAPTVTNTVTSSSVSVSAKGGSASNTITITPANNFTGTVTLSSTVSPATSAYMPTVTLSAYTLSFSGTAAQTVTATVNTTAASSSARTGTALSSAWPGSTDGHSPSRLALTGGMFLVCALFFGLPWKSRRGRMLLLIGAVLVILTMAGCGGGGSSNSGGGGTTITGTPSGTYTVTVTATSGSSVNVASTFIVTVP